MATEPKIMRTEARKKYKCGFALNEGEVRRLHDVLMQQIKRTPSGDEFHTRYEMKFRNGTVTFPTTLDEVLAEENFGAGSISRLEMDVYDGKANKLDSPDLIEIGSPNLIRVLFQNPEAAEWSFEEPIMYTVKGEDRDWVFVTSSQLEERIQKIRLFAPNSGDKYGSRFWLDILPTIFTVFVAILFLMASESKSHIQAMKELDSIQRDWASGALKGPEEASIRTARALVDSQEIFRSIPYRATAIVIAIPVSLLLLKRMYTYFNPAYNFIWGDYIETYEKRKAHGRLLLVAVVLALLITVVGNIISKKIGI